MTEPAGVDLKIAWAKLLIAELATNAAVHVAVDGEPAPGQATLVYWKFMAPVEAADWPPHLKALQWTMACHREELLAWSYLELTERVRARWIGGMMAAWEAALGDNIKAFREWQAKEMEK